MAIPTKTPESKPHIAADHRSPFFARVAAGYVEEGRTRDALALCIEGVKTFPRYVTGSLILGKCYEALGGYAEALVEYRRVLEAFPDNSTVKALAERVEQMESDAFRRFAESMEVALLPKRETITFSEFATGSSQVHTSTVEYLIRQLQQAPKMPRNSIMPAIPVVHEDLSAGAEQSPAIVTETLAEIYASQGQFREAIHAYKALVEQKPEDAQRFAERIAQLEELVRLEGESGAQ
jgi:tetratricopeptide (TPR) repeat protein